jgi:hypothetical protein
MTAVHQLLPTASPHDAITGQALARRDLIREWGYESEIVAAEALHELASSSTRSALYDAADRRLAELHPDVLGHGRGPA